MKMVKLVKILLLETIMAKQKTIETNPLEHYLSLNQTIQTSDSPTTTKPDPKISVARKQRMTIYIPVDLIDKIKNAVYWEPDLTIAAFAEQALSKALFELEEGRGSAYPFRKKERLAVGRPVK